MAPEEPWRIELTTKVAKAIGKLPVAIQDRIGLLLKEMAYMGPLRRERPNFGPLAGRGIPENSYHCHIKKGRPTYVACWRILSKKERIIEVYYVGTHENAPY